MVTPDTRGGHFVSRVLSSLLLALLLLSGVTACADASQNAAATDTPTTLPATPTQADQTPGSLQPFLTPTTGVASVLRGPTNFVLKTPFTFSSATGSTTDDSGNSTTLSDSMVETGITQEFQHLLFVVDSSNNVEVYNPGSTSPTRAQVTQRTDGSVNIDYTQTLKSDLGSAQITFDAAMFDNQIYTQFQQDYSPVIASSGVGSSVTAAFSTHVQWVSANQIPLAPQNARFQFRDNQSIALAWDAGKSAVSYDVYRIIPNENQQFQFLATVKDTTYVDTSADAWQNAHSAAGITYGVFSVGPTGVENPSGLPIPIATN